jgi:hypothetical protein
VFLQEYGIKSLLFVLARFRGIDMEDRADDISHDDGTVLDAGRYAGGEAPV